MSWFTGIVVYLVIWWTMLFAVLPWGVKRNENPDAGHDSGAPLKPLLIRKFVWTSLIAAVIWLGYYLTNRYNIFSFR